MESKALAQTGGKLAVPERRLTQAQFQKLEDLPEWAEWFANLDNANTRKLYQRTLGEFFSFLGLDPTQREEFRQVTRAHVLAFRHELEQRGLAAATIRVKLSALSSLFDFLCDSNAITHNPVSGVKRPTEGANEGKTPAIGNDQARMLLALPDTATLKGKRDRAILSTFLFHGLRISELIALNVGSVTQRGGVTHFTVKGKGSKIAWLPVHVATLNDIEIYRSAAGHASGALFRSTRSEKRIHENTVRQLLKHYAVKAGIQIENFSPHALRATAATNALENGADIAKVQELLRHANISTTRLYDRRQSRPEDSATFKIDFS